MRIALFSDVHANLPALEAVLADIDAQKPDSVYCLGDLVGYAPFPNEVIQCIRARQIPCIAGNYDEGVGQNSNDCGCAYKTEIEQANGALSISYTNARIGAAERAYLRMLPRQIALEFWVQTERIRLLLVHGSPRRINEYLFEDRPEASLLRLMQDAHTEIMAFGHTHKPYHRVLTAADGTYRHAINTGSVGKPKDGDARACYVLLDINPQTSRYNPALNVRFVRVPYAIEHTTKAIEQSPLPNIFADMLKKAY